MFKVGDKVRVRKDMVVDKMYRGLTFVADMEKYKGKIFEIVSAASGKYCNRNEYELKNIKWCWTDEMLEPASEERTCRNCKHRDVKSFSLPCTGCNQHTGNRGMWEPKEEQHWIKSAYDKAQGLDRTAYKTYVMGEWRGIIYNVVFVTHDDDYVKMPFGLKQYLFAVPHDVTIKKGDKLFADTRKGKKIVTAYTGSFKIDKAGLDAMDIMNGCHKGELKLITGYAQKQEEWKEVPFK